jgi:hypothetical protein
MDTSDSRRLLVDPLRYQHATQVMARRGPQAGNLSATRACPSAWASVTVSSSAAARVTPCSSALPSTPSLAHALPTAIALYCNRFARRPQRPESAATPGAGAGAGGSDVWMAVSRSRTVVRDSTRTGNATNAPTVEADNAARTTGSECRRRARRRCALLHTTESRTASDHQDEQARACAQRDLRPADVRHNLEL